MMGLQAANEKTRKTNGIIVGRGGLTSTSHRPTMFEEDLYKQRGRREDGSSRAGVSTTAARLCRCRR